MPSDLHEVFKKDLDQISLRPSSEWVPTRATLAPRSRVPIAPRPVVAFAVVVVLVVAAAVGLGLRGLRDGSSNVLAPSASASAAATVDPADAAAQAARLANATPRPDVVAACRVTQPDPALSSIVKLDCALPPILGYTTGGQFDYGNDALAVYLPTNGELVMSQPNMSTGVKFGWYRLTGGKLSVSGGRDGSPAASLEVEIPDGYGDAGLQITSLDFPKPGCWHVRGTVSGETLEFTLFVADAALERPLAIPSLAPRAACPESPISSDATLGIATPRGSGPVYIGGPSPKGGYAWNKMVYAAPDASAAIYMRGARIDGLGTIKFTGEQAVTTERSEDITGPAGTWPFYAAVALNRLSDAFYVYPSVPGCYAIQLDSRDFQEVIVIRAP